MEQAVQRDMEEAVQAHKKSSKTTSTDAENVDPLTTNISSEKGFLHFLWPGMKGMDPNLSGTLLFGAGVGIFLVAGLMILVVVYGAWLYNNKR
ncbi:hypothetical protein HN51_067540 [Arachis hypogaea]